MTKVLVELELDGVGESHKRDELILAVEGEIAGASLSTLGPAVVVDSATVTEFDGESVP